MMSVIMNIFQEQFEDVTNVSMIEEERFNVTEHRGFLHGFVEAISVILVRFQFITKFINLSTRSLNEISNWVDCISAPTVYQLLGIGLGG